MIGKIILYSHDAHVLYDIGSTHSYVSISFTLRLNKDLVLLDQPFYVAIPVGESLLVKYVYKIYKITMADRKTIVDLSVLDMLEFDVILGIN